MCINIAVLDNMAETLVKSYLISTKLNAEKTKSKIDTLYSFRHNLMDIFANLDPLQEEIQNSLDKMWVP